MSEFAEEVAATGPILIGRYALFDEIAAGGMATVHLGRLLGPVGFGRTVAIKRLHPHFLKDQEFITMFMDEARIVARIRHPNVVPMVDVVQSEQGLFLVMEYVHGESLSRLMRTARKAEEPIPPRIVAAIMCGVLFGLHAAHETKGEDGALLDVVHRDVSPQNIIVGVDGAARVLDFGIAKAAGRAQITRAGQVKGKLTYMAPEQITGTVDRRTDLFAAAVVLWEMLAGRRLHDGAQDIDIVMRIVNGSFPPPSAFARGISPELDAIVMRGLASNPEWRQESARDLALDLSRSVGLAAPSEVGAWVERVAHEVILVRGNLVSAMELAANELIGATSQQPSGLGMNAPVVHEGSQAHDLTGTGRPDPASNSAVFAYTPLGQDSHPATAAQSPRPRPRSSGIVNAISAVLVLVGAALATYALVHRAVRAAPMASGAGARSATPSAPQRDEPSPGPANASASPLAATSLTSTAAPTSTPRARGNPPPFGRTTPAPASPAPVAKPRPNCDPPYTVDEVGHRHYKPECD